MTPEQKAAEQARILAFQQQQVAARQQAAALAAAEQQKARAFQQRPVAPNMAPARAVGQGRFELDPIYDARKFLTNDVILPIADATVGQGPIAEAFGGAVNKARDLTSGIFASPYTREREAAAVPKAAASVVAPAPKPSTQPRSEAPGPALWSPFAGYQTVEGGEPGAPRDGGARQHRGRDYAGMKVGTPIMAPPMGAELVGSGSDRTSGNWGKWRMPDGSVMSVAHLVNQPTESVVGPGKPLAFLGNTGNAKVRDPRNAVAHVRTWDAKGREIDPAQAFGGGQGGGQMAGGGGGAQGDLPQTRAVRDTIAGFLPNVPAPDERGFNIMNAAIGEAAKRATQPFSYSYATPERPELPEPGLAVQPNYAPADAAFAAGKPVNPFGTTAEEQEKNKLKMRRASYFSGLASGLANFRDGTGIGQLLANMGGAALQGRFQGDENVRSKMEEFDTNMSKYNLAMANREEGKAKDFANIANDNIRTTNRYNEQKYTVAMQEFDEMRPQLDEQGRLTTTNVDPATGQTTVHKTVVDPTTISKYLLMHGENEVRRSAGRTEAEQLEYRAQAALADSLIPMAIAEATKVGDWEKRDNLVLYAGTQAAYKLVQQGTWGQAMSEVPGGAEQAAAMDRDAWQAAGVQLDPKTGAPSALYGKPTERQQELHDNYVASNLVGFFLDSQHMSNLVGGMVQDILPGTEREAGGPRLPRGAPKYRYKGASPTVQQSIQAFDAAHTKRTSRETAKGQRLDTEAYSPY